MVAGHAKQTAKRSLLEMSLNIIISVVLVQFIGIYGVLVGSFASLFYRANDMIIYTNIKIFKRKPWKEYKVWGSNLLLFATVVYLSRFVHLDIVSYFDFIKYGAIISVLCIGVFFITSILVSYKEYRFFYMFANRWLVARFKRN